MRNQLKDAHEFLARWNGFTRGQIKNSTFHIHDNSLLTIGFDNVVMSFPEHALGRETCQSKGNSHSFTQKHFTQKLSCNLCIHWTDSKLFESLWREAIFGKEFIANFASRVSVDSIIDMSVSVYI